MPKRRDIRPETVLPLDWYDFDKYMPNATALQKLEAYENLQGLSEVLIQIDERLAREHQEKKTKLQPTLFELDSSP